MLKELEGEDALGERFRGRGMGRSSGPNSSMRVLRMEGTLVQPCPCP